MSRTVWNRFPFGPAVALATALVFLLASPGSAQTVVDVLTAPDYAWGLDYHDGYLWVGDDVDGYIHQIDPADGSEVGTIATPYDQDHIAYGANHGVAWDGSGFWVAGDYGKAWLYKVSITGAPLDTIPSPTDAVGGLHWDGTYLLVTTYYPNPSAGILKVDPSDGTVVGPTIPTQGAQPYGIFYDSSDGTLWNGMDDNDGDPEKIWNLNYADGSVISSFDSPAQSPKGLVIAEGYMWVIANQIGGNGRRIYKIDLGGAGTPDITPIPPSREFGIVALGTTVQSPQTLRNDGDGDLVITSLTTLPPFSFDPQSLPATLTPGQQLTFNVYFEPTVAGDFQGALHVESNDFDEGSLDVPLTGTGVYPDPTIVVSPPSLSFLDTGTGLVRGLTLTIENVGYDDLVVSDVQSDNSVFEVPGGGGPLATLGTFQTYDVQVIFRPATAVPYDGTITILSNDPDDPSKEVPVSGDGVVATFAPGEKVWSAQGIENVVSVLAIPDVTDDGIPDAVMETYDAGASGDPSQAFYGNSQGTGVRIWSTGEGGSGGWGDQCLALSSDLDGDGSPEFVRGTAWGGKRVEVRHADNGGLLWDYDTHVDDNGGWVYSVASMPDISGDGIPEIVAGAGTDGAPGTGSRRLYCFDGATGAKRFAYVGIDAFLSVAWIEDVNGDGVPDVLGGAGGNDADDRVYCISGASSGIGTSIWQFHTGGAVWTLDVIDDVNGDGIDDVLAGSWSGYVFCLDGTDGSVLWQHNLFGEILRVEAIDDVTGDGNQDVIVAQLGTSVRLVNGATGAIYWSYPVGGNVWSASSIPDVDGDGKTDVLAGSQTTNSVFCVSGASGDLIWSRNVQALVYSVRSIPDVTGNGTPDVLVGTQYLSSGGLIWCLEGGAQTVGVEEPPVANLDPWAVRFSGFWPNPTRGPGTFLIESGSQAGAPVQVDIFDLAGRRVRSLNLVTSPGLNPLRWDARGSNGLELPSGVYYYRLRGLREAEAGSSQTEGKLTLIR